MPLNYLLDEHVPPAYQAQLLRQEPTLVVWRVGTPGAPPRGTLDPEILLWCETNNFVLVTNNRKSMPAHLADHLSAGRHIPGILTINMAHDMAQNLADLLLAALAAQPNEFADRIVYLPF